MNTEESEAPDFEKQTCLLTTEKSDQQLLASPSWDSFATQTTCQRPGRAVDRSQPLNLLPRASSQEEEISKGGQRRKEETAPRGKTGLAKYWVPNSLEGKQPKSSLTRGTRQKHTVSQTLFRGRGGQGQQQASVCQSLLARGCWSRTKSWPLHQVQPRELPMNTRKDKVPIASSRCPSGKPESRRSSPQ